MKALCISDTHSQHQLFPKWKYKGVDLIIHAGDATNYKDVSRNYNEMVDFLEWYSELPIKYIVYVAGNHDASMYHKAFNKKDLEAMGIIYLENSEVVIEGIKIYGSPMTPTYGDWYFMANRSKINKYWQMIPEDTDILVTHGPPKYILDTVEHNQEFSRSVGCSALAKTVHKIEPDYHIFGHIHSQSNIINSGIYQNNIIKTKYINASCVTDGKFEKGLTSFGHIITI